MHEIQYIKQPVLGGGYWCDSMVWRKVFNRVLMEDVMKMITVNTADEARQQAIDWQASFEHKDYSYSELYEWSMYFKQLANKYDLITEFKENGII